jgi:hypothetical protein
VILFNWFLLPIKNEQQELFAEKVGEMAMQSGFSAVPAKTNGPANVLVFERASGREE